jgi:hypothetical protein
MKKHYLLLLLVHLSTMQIKGTISDEGNLAFYFYFQEDTYNGTTSNEQSTVQLK